jgi:hypothetical protein
MQAAVSARRHRSLDKRELLPRIGAREQALDADPKKHEDLGVPVMDGREGGHAELEFRREGEWLS